MTGSVAVDSPVQDMAPDGTAYISTMPQDSKSRIREIKRVILEEEHKVRERYPILNNQDELGLAIFLGSLAIVAGAGFYYMKGSLPWYLTIPLVAFAVSMLHELEHDLIHNQYFKGQKWLQSIMFSGIWLAKFHANPWWRRDVHHWHHRVSGQKNDIEERLLGLGLGLGWARLGITLHPQGSVMEVPSMKADSGDALDLPYMNRTNIWTAVAVLLLIKAFPILLALRYLDVYQFESLFPAVRDFMVILVYPLILRQTCLVAMSTACHYYGDVPENNVYFQNQIINHWVLYPFQLFCWGFGGTHIIHHYVPNQPFYLRSLIATPVWDEMVSQGVRRNDWGIVYRANRWNISENQAKWAETTAAVWFMALALLGAFWVFVWDLVVMPTLLKLTFLMIYRPLENLFVGHKVLFLKKEEQQARSARVAKKVE